MSTDGGVRFPWRKSMVGDRLEVVMSGIAFGNYRLAAEKIGELRDALLSEDPSELLSSDLADLFDDFSNA